MMNRLIDWLYGLLCRGRIWNRDMSLENDALRIQIESLRERIAELKAQQ